MAEEAKKEEWGLKDLLELEKRVDRLEVLVDQIYNSFSCLGREYGKSDDVCKHGRKVLTYPEMFAFMDYFDETSEKESTEYSEHEMKVMIEDFLEEFRK